MEKEKQTRVIKLINLISILSAPGWIIVKISNMIWAEKAEPQNRIPVPSRTPLSRRKQSPELSRLGVNYTVDLPLPDKFDLSLKQRDFSSVRFVWTGNHISHFVIKVN